MSGSGGSEEFEVRGDAGESSWSYPELFDVALRELYERSFNECDLPSEVQLAVLEAPQWDLESDDGPPTHTLEMWIRGRLDLTAELLLLGNDWNAHFPPRWIERAETHLAAFAYFSEQQALLDAGIIVSDLANPRLENCGYRVRIVDKRAYLIYEPIPWVSTLHSEIPYHCEWILDRDRSLRRIPFLKYDDDRAHHHHLFCESCQSKALITFELFRVIADEQFHRMRLFLANLVECLDFSESKRERLAAALADPEQHRTVRNALLWRPFLLSHYLPYVCDVSRYCAQPGTYKQPVNPWTTLRSGSGNPEAVRFVRSLNTQMFEAAVLAHEITAAIEDYPDFLAFREKTFPMKPLLIPSADEGLRPIRGFLDLRENATLDDWSAFLRNTVAEEMPWWGFDLLEAVVNLAAKAAKLAQVECGLEVADATSNERLTAIESQTHAIYGAQRPMWELQEDTKRAVDEVARQQTDEMDLLQQIRNQLTAPRTRDAEASLRRLLGESVFGALTAEAKAAAIEGELRFLQRECSDPSVIPLQLAKAFECQLRTTISEPYCRYYRILDELGLRDIYTKLKNREANLLSFLRTHSFDCDLLKRSLSKLIDKNKGQPRNLAAHRADMSEQRARELRDDWLGVGKNGDSIFSALVPKQAESTGNNGPHTGKSQGSTS